MSNYDFINEYIPIIVNADNIQSWTIAPTHIYHMNDSTLQNRTALLDGAQINWQGLTLCDINFGDSKYINSNGYSAWVDVFNKLQNTINELETRLSTLETPSFTLSSNSNIDNLVNGARVTLIANGLPAGEIVEWTTRNTNTNWRLTNINGNSVTVILNHSIEPAKGTIRVQATSGSGPGKTELQAIFTAGSPQSIAPFTVQATYNGITKEITLTASDVQPLSRLDYSWSNVTPINPDLSNIRLEVNPTDNSKCIVYNSSTISAIRVIIRATNDNADPSYYEWEDDIYPAQPTTYTITYQPGNGAYASAFGEIIDTWTQGYEVGNSSNSSGLSNKIVTTDPNVYYRIEKWNGSDGRTYNFGSDISSLSANLTLTAVWAQCYQVSYYLNDGTSTDLIESTYTSLTRDVNNNYAITLSNDTPTRADDANYTYSFANWNTQRDGNGTSYNAGSKIYIGQNTALYAHWNKTPITHDTYLLYIGPTSPYEINNINELSPNAILYDDTLTSKPAWTNDSRHPLNVPTENTYWLVLPRSWKPITIQYGTFPVAQFDIDDVTGEPFSDITINEAAYIVRQIGLDQYPYEIWF